MHAYAPTHEKIDEPEHSSQQQTTYSAEWWENMIISLTLLGISGIMSGLTIGLASIDHLTLEIAAK